MDHNIPSATTCESSSGPAFDISPASQPNPNLQPGPSYPPYNVRTPRMFTRPRPMLIESPHPLPFAPPPTFRPPSPFVPIYPPTPSPPPAYPLPRTSQEPNPPYLQAFWANQLVNIERRNDFRTYSLPLARIRKIMKSDEAVKMVSSEVLSVVALSSELFILEMTLRAWNQAENNRMSALQRNDLASVVSENKVFDFLAGILPKEGPASGEGSAPPAAREAEAAASVADSESDSEFDLLALIEDPVDVPAWQQMLAEIDERKFRIRR